MIRLLTRWRRMWDSGEPYKLGDLRTMLETLEEAAIIVRFYGDKKHWGKDALTDEPTFFSEKSGGLKARQLLKKWGEE